MHTHTQVPLAATFCFIFIVVACALVNYRLAGIRICSFHCYCPVTSHIIHKKPIKYGRPAAKHKKIKAQEWNNKHVPTIRQTTTSTLRANDTITWSLTGPLLRRPTIILSSYGYTSCPCTRYEWKWWATALLTYVCQIVKCEQQTKLRDRIDFISGKAVVINFN